MPYRFLTFDSLWHMYYMLFSFPLLIFLLTLRIRNNYNYLGFLQAVITNVLFYVVHFLIGRGNGVGIQRGRPRARHPGGGRLEESCVGQRQRCRVCPDDRPHFHLAGTGWCSRTRNTSNITITMFSHQMLLQFMLDRVGNPRAVLLRAVRRGVLRHRRRGHQKVGRSQGHQRLVTLS